MVVSNVGNRVPINVAGNTVEVFDHKFTVPPGEGNLVIRLQDKAEGSPRHATVEWMDKNANLEDLKKGDQVISINTHQSSSPQIAESELGVESKTIGDVLPTGFYFYFDHNTGSFRLKDQYATYPNRPAKAVQASDNFDTSFQSSLALSGKYLPSKCKDGSTYGFSDYTTFRNAVNELSASYSHAVKRYHEQRGALQEHVQLGRKSSDNIVIEDIPKLPEYILDFLNIVPDPFVICPGAHLRPLIHDRPGAIFINAEDATIECDACIIEAPGTHLSFGPLAKNALVRGVTLIGATDTSVIFRHDGANAVFEDCSFFQNEGAGAQGAVVDVNSTSFVEFYRCEINEFQSGTPRNVGGQQVHALTLRGKNNNQS